MLCQSSQSNDGRRRKNKKQVAEYSTVDGQTTSTPERYCTRKDGRTDRAASTDAQHAQNKLYGDNDDIIVVSAVGVHLEIKD